MDRKLELAERVQNIEHPRCVMSGCRGDPTLAVCRDRTGMFTYFCDKHREDKKREARRAYSWRLKLRVQYGINFRGRPHG